MNNSNSKTIIKHKIEELIILNEQCNEMYKQYMKIKTKKNSIENEINRLLTEHGMEYKTFVLNNYKIQHKTTTQYQSLSLKYIHSCLSQHIPQDKLEEIMTFIRNKRSSKEKQEISLSQIQ